MQINNKTFSFKNLFNLFVRIFTFQQFNSTINKVSFCHPAVSNSFLKYTALIIITKHASLNEKYRLRSDFSCGSVRSGSTLLLYRWSHKNLIKRQIDLSKFGHKKESPIKQEFLCIAFLHRGRKTELDQGPVVQN